MKLRHAIGSATLLATLVGMSGCGGGGSGDGAAVDEPSYPSSGAFGWVLKASGPTDALKKGLSLLHPSKPDTEYVIEVASAVVSDARLVSSGSVDTSQLRATSVQPHSLIYIVGGDVRIVPMQANGAAPLTRVQRSQSTSACRFVLEANDHATPLNSRYIASTAGADGQCDTADDGRAELALTSSGGLRYTPIAGDLPLGVVHDPTTLAPRGWIYPRNVALWATTPATTIATRTAPSPAIANVVSSTYRSALVEDGTQLSVLSFAGGATVSETLLDATITAGSGWTSIGFDASNTYVYRNAGSSFSSTWTVLKITRSNPTASVMATGTGLVTVVSMGRDLLYLTVFGQTDNRLVRIGKAGGTPVETTSALTTLTTVQTSANGVHQLWRITGVGSASPTYTIDIVDENNTTLYTSAGGFPMSVAEAGTENFNTSESRTQFIFAGGYGARAFGDASLVGYDTATNTARVLGNLPGTAQYGSDFVFASAIGGPTAAGFGFAARSVAGVVQETGARVFSYDLTTANSLKTATLVK